MADISEFTDNLGKGDVNLGFLIGSQIYRVTVSGSKDIRNNEVFFTEYKEAVKTLRDLLYFKFKDDKSYKDAIGIINDPNEKADDVERWRSFFQLLIIKADEYGLLPAEDTSLKE